MASAAFRVYFNDEAADQARLELLREIRVDQAIGMATEAELTLDIGLDENGSWSDIEEDFTQPFGRVRLEIKSGDDYVALIDGPIVAQSFELSGDPNSSKLVLIAQDDSVLLNQKEEVGLFEDKTAGDIAEQLFRDQGLDAEVDPVDAVAGGLPRVVVQRGTAMHLLRELARRHGMFVYVKPGPSPGASVGVFQRPRLQESDLPEILIVGAKRNVNQFTVKLDALRPVTATAACVRVTDQTVLTKTASTSGLTGLGDKAAHDVVPPGEVLLARTREEDGDLEAAAAAAVDHSSWAYSATGEVTADVYPAVLSPYQVVKVAGAGGHLSGSYLVSQVSHTVNDEAYRQRFTLRRNARSDGASSSGLPGGVF